MRTFCNKKTIPLLFILLLLLLPAASFAEFVGSFSRIEGRVDLLRAGATTVAPARRGDGVSTGDIIRTKSDGRAEILFKDNTTVTIASETRLKIDEYTFNPDNSRNKGMLSLLRGKLRAAVSKVKAGLIPVSLGSSTFSINTPTSVAGVRGTVLFVFYERGITGVVFKEGNGFVYNQNMPDRIVNVSEGQATFILEEDAPPLPPRPATEAEISRYVKDTTIEEAESTNDTDSTDKDSGGTDAGQAETTQDTSADASLDTSSTDIDTGDAGAGLAETSYEYSSDTLSALGETGVEDTSDIITTDTGVDADLPPTVLPITETETGTLEETVPPLITITEAPQAITNSSTGSFTVTADEPVTFTYSMDSLGVTTEITTSDTITLAGLPEGSHTLTITATDEAGNISTTSYTWTTDYTPPESLALSGTPASITNVNNATIGASATDANGVTFSYTLDGEASTGSLSGLSDGSHTFVATATDGAGNTSTTSYTWTTDTIAPASLALSGTPASITNINNATMGATATDATTITYSYTLDSVTSTGNLTGLTEGPHTFVVTATDAAGNVSTSSYAWTTDYTAPVVTYAASPDPSLTSPLGIISFTGNDPSAAYSYDIDGVTSTSQTISFTGIAEGSHTLSYSATDAAGNSSTNTLTFFLSRYSLSGSASASDISYLFGGSVTTGEVAGVSNQNWGGWKIVMSGWYEGMPSSSFTLYTGGTSIDTTTTNNGGYWIDIISGTSGGASLSGTSNLKYLSYDRLGTGTGAFSGTYDGLGWSATDTGTYTETPLAWSGKIVPDGNTNVSYPTGAGLYSLVPSGWLDIKGTSTGLMGGTTAPWSGTTSVTYMGIYGASVAAPYLWTPEIYSYNVNNATNTTFDNGAYKGFIGGVWKGDGKIDAKVYSLYIDPSGNAGILKGTVAGAYSPQIYMFDANGTWAPTTLTSGLTATTATYNVVPTNYGYNITSSGSFGGTGSITVSGNEMLTATDWRYSITGQDWGVSKSIIGGTYTGPTSDTWSLSTTVTLPTTIYGTKTDGTKWSSDVSGNNVLAGTTYGYGADITTTPMTWISVGETIGTFDAAALTWQAVQTGAWLDTNRFLSMTQNSADQAKLAALNIPFVEVGKANLSGSGTMGGAPINVNMTDVTFFAYSNGDAPKIWATGNVSGDYGCSACGVATVGLTSTSGGSLSANFNVQNFDTSGKKWIATVSGSGTLSGGSYSGPTTFNGAAAGINGGIGPSTFSGTGAGVAQ